MNSSPIKPDSQLIKQSDAIQKLMEATEVLDAVSSSYFITNTDLQIIYCNRAFLENNNYLPSKEVRGLRPGDVLQCNNAKNKSGGCGTTFRCKHCNLRCCIIEAVKENHFIDREVVLTHVDNKMMAIRITATPFELAGEKFISVSSIDITDRKRKQLMESLFFHDLINLAGSLSGYLDVVSNFPAEEAVELLPQMKQIADQVLDEVMAQREVSRAEQNRLEADITEVSINEVLDALKDKMMGHPYMKGRHLHVKYALENFSLYTDPRLLDRVLLNMLKNALEFINRGETITLSFERNEEEVIFKVHNPGFIPDKDQNYIFHFGFSTKGKGRGLGTYSMRLLGENLLKGKVWFTSTPEEGTSFYLQIPTELQEEELSELSDYRD